MPDMGNSPYSSRYRESSQNQSSRSRDDLRPTRSGSEASRSSKRPPGRQVRTSGQMSSRGESGGWWQSLFQKEDPRRASRRAKLNQQKRPPVIDQVASVSYLKALSDPEPKQRLRRGSGTTAGSGVTSRNLSILPASGRHVSGASLRREVNGRARQTSLGGRRTLAPVEAAPVSGRAATRPPRRSNPTPSRPQPRSISAALYATRMVILSVGIGVLAGTMLSAWDPAHRSQNPAQQANKSAVSDTANQAAALMPIKLGQEANALRASLEAFAQQNTQFTPGVFFLDLDSNSYMDFNGSLTYAAASTIKVPILVAFLQDVDAGKVRLDEMLTLRQEHIGGGSGELQGMPVGSKFTALDVATKMIIISDNTATNMIIARLGGMASLNQRFKSWGMSTTVLNNLLPDLEGTNTTSPKDLSLLMTRISQGELMSLKSRDRLLDIMGRTVNRSQLPQGLDPGARISHKTGDIGALIGDTGLVDLPNGKRYAVTVLVKRGFNDDRAYDIVKQISRLVYQYVSKPPAPPRPAAPAAQPSPKANPT